uniref:Uncharacterized protein n=1 Tax=Arundo donax TaxID=35708 RepID=A0A0A9BAP7_ARUDO
MVVYNYNLCFPQIKNNYNLSLSKISIMPLLHRRHVSIVAFIALKACNYCVNCFIATVVVLTLGSFTCAIRYTTGQNTIITFTRCNPLM